MLSANTIGGRRWTDGKVFYPMFRRPPSITRCSTCAGFFWVLDAKAIGEIDSFADEPENIPSEWRDAKHIRELSEQEYLEAIEAGMAGNRHEELNLRIRAWWAGNDSLRKNAESDAAQSPFLHSSESRENLERIVDLLNTGNPDEHLMKAEALRELGRFGEALQVLSAVFPGQLTEPANYIRRLAEEHDPLVTEFPVVDD